MSLKRFMTVTASTFRKAPMSNNLVPTQSEQYLTGVKLTPITPSGNTGDMRVMQAQGLDGATVHRFATYTQKHRHTQQRAKMYKDLANDWRKTYGSSRTDIVVGYLVESLDQSEDDNEDIL
jgi:hypothetical protein